MVTRHNKTDELNSLIYETPAEYDGWVKLVQLGIPSLTFVISVAVFVESKSAFAIMLALTLFYALLFHAIFPRKFQIFSDRLRVVLGRPFAFNLRLSNIKQAKAGAGSKAFFYGGIRFATSSRSVTEIIRRKGMSIVISPANRDSFLDQLSRTLEAQRQGLSASG